MSRPGEQIVFEDELATHADHYTDVKRADRVENTLAGVRHSINFALASHFWDKTFVYVTVSVGDVEFDLAAEPNLGCLDPVPGSILDIEEPVDTSFRVWQAIAVGFVMYALGFATHAGFAYETEAMQLRAMSVDQIETDLGYYQGMLHNASGAGCQMSIEQFRRYHALDDELDRRRLQTSAEQ